MPTNPYPVFGALLPPMLGRTALVERIAGHLLKPTPDHISVVGPAHYGKSVLLSHLGKLYCERTSHYLTAAHLDLRHGTPESDSAFKRRLAERIKGALQQLRSDLSEWIDIEDANIHESLSLVLEELEKENVRLLVVVDGFDYVLARAGLTRTLWDQLRALAQSPSLRLVAGSRRPLRELCRTEESRTSDFWEIFYDTPVRVSALDDSDWPAFLQPLRDGGCVIDASAQNEIANWTGGVPLFVCALLKRLWDERRGERLSKAEVDQAANAVLDNRGELLAALWDDCDDETRADLGRLSEGPLALADLSDSRHRAVVDRGFARVSGNRLRGSCRLMERYAKSQAPAMADLNRVFGTASGFEKHIRSLLELRLKQMTRPEVDEDLSRFVHNAVRDITPRPEDALTWVRSIAHRALERIWYAELPDRTIPAEWLAEWKRAEAYRDSNNGRLPDSRSAQYHILRLLRRSDLSASTHVITTTTSLLVDHLQSVGNFGSHLSDYPEVRISVGFAAAVVLAAIALVECLAGDLERSPAA